MVSGYNSRSVQEALELALPLNHPKHQLFFFLHITTVNQFSMTMTKKHELINLEKRKVCFGSRCWRFQSTVVGLFLLCL